MPGADTISEIIDVVVTVLGDLTPPSNAPAQPYVYPDTVAAPNVPCFITAPSQTPLIERVTGTRRYTHVINIYLLFASKSLEYASKAQRAWVPVVLDAFDKRLNLNGACQKAEITSLVYEPVIINDIPYQGLTFTLTAWTNEPFEFGING